MADASVTVIGAGVVGLAVAARLAPRHPDLVLVERHPRHGQETSSRNSEVVHAGMYYSTGSLKARLCVEGNRLLYEACARAGVAHRRCGKLITATRPEEAAALDQILHRGHANGVALTLVTGEQARALEPRVRSYGAIVSPDTGIVSAHELMDHLLHAAVQSGALWRPRSQVVEIERRTGDYRIAVRTGDDVESFTSERVVNAAGLFADEVAALAGIDVEAAGYRQYYWKGSYFALAPRHAGIVSRLIYPVPDAVSLGVHAVLGLDGRLRLGPDTEHLPDRRLDYTVDESRRPAFAAAARRLLPEIEDEDLTPDMSGIRPKLQAPGAGFRDFVIAEESARGRPGLVDLVGIDSPGLTSSLAIAAEVERLLA